MPLSVLLVDDNPTFLRVLQDFLADYGAGLVQVVGAVVGGRHAVAQAEQLHPQVILLDLQMPDVPGLDLLPPLRTRLPEALLIALSLRDPEEYRAQTLAAGADAFVAKACLARDLLPTIQRLAARQPQRGMTSQEG